MNAQFLHQARQLSVQDQLELMETLWESMTKDSAPPGPTRAQKAELDRRLADHEANPNDIAPWSEVKAAALAHIGQ